MKEYNQPQIEVLDINANTILAGSIKTKTGKTGNQLAKRRLTKNTDDFEDWDDFDDFDDVYQLDFLSSRN